MRFLAPRPVIAALLASLLNIPVGAGEIEDLRAMMFRKQHAQVIAQTDPATSKSADNPEVRFIRALALAESGRIDDAIAAFVKLAGEFPQQGVLHNNLAVLYAQQNQLGKARDALQMAVEATPDYPVAHENMGDLYVRLALQSYKKSQQLDGNERIKSKVKLAEDSARLTSQTADDAATSTAADKPAVNAASSKQPSKAKASTASPNPPLSVEDALAAWANAWSQQDVDAYLAAYSPRFTPEGKQSLAAWQKERRARLTAPKSIQVEISDVVTENQGDERAKVRFKQRYVSDRFKNQLNKVMTLEKSAAGWLIVNEQEDK